MAMVFFMARQFKRAQGPRAARPHLVTFERRYAINASPLGRGGGAECHPGPHKRVTEMIHSQKTDKTYVSDPGERWRRFLERIGTRSNDFGTRLSRARFVYLHRRETGAHWLPL
jgi:hypothetical protein